MVNVDLLREAPFFRILNEDELIEIGSIAEEIKLGRKRIVFHQGDRADSFYVIIDGEVIVKKQVKNTEEKIVTLRKGALLGEMGFMIDQERSGTVETSTRTTLLKLPKKEFTELLGKKSFAAYKLIYKIAQILSFRLARLGEQVITLMDDDFKFSEERGLLNYIKNLF